MGDKTCASFFCGYEQHFSPTLNLNYLLQALPCLCSEDYVHEHQWCDSPGSWEINSICFSLEFSRCWYVMTVISFAYSAWIPYRWFILFRFHLLAEFDEAKRSCRKRLDGHNRRRRKPQPDTMNSGSFMTSQQGILCFCSASTLHILYGMMVHT